MSYALRSIAFVAELIHPPVKHEPRGLQSLHSELFESSDCDYRDFRLVPGGAQFSNSPQNGLPGTPVSVANVLADRIQVREEQTGCSKEDFEARLSSFAKNALNVLPMQLFMVQQFAVRSVINPHTSNDARAFMIQTVFGHDEGMLSVFPTSPSLSGMRFTFPPDPETQAVFNVRLESYSQDNRSLFLENVGTFGKPVTSAELPELTQRFSSTYDFLQGEVIDFVSQFDTEDA
ncbi:MAG: hypothetical protein P8N09_09095 [Planctomycetota bacterium]|jgi:hypothetical protein|nr:hypothetical protein [Planctomycetota bacterium]